MIDLLMRPEGMLIASLILIALAALYIGIIVWDIKSEMTEKEMKKYDKRNND